MTRLLATHGMRLVLVGSAFGLAVSLLVSPFLASLLFGLATAAWHYRRLAKRSMSSASIRLDASLRRRTP